MRKPIFLSILFTVCLLFSISNDYGQGRPIPPGIREADKLTNPPIEAPLPPRTRPRDPGQLQEEAAELARLSAGIPAQIERVNQGQFPKDLSVRLKRIEKLAKHLRSELAP